MRLKSLREKFRASQQAVNERRQEWCRLLNALGMEETVKIPEAFDWWRRIQEVRELHTQWRNSAPEAEGLKRMFDGMKARVQQLGMQVEPSGKLNYSRPLEVLTGWSQQLKTHDRDRTERERLTREADKLHRESISEQQQVEASEIRRGSVLARAGVMARDELLVQLDWQKKRAHFDGLLSAATEELNEMAFSEPEMAVMEDDIARFDPRSGREKITMLAAEQSDVKSSLE